MKKSLFLITLFITSLFLNGQIVIYDGASDPDSYYYYQGIPFKLVTDNTYQVLVNKNYYKYHGIKPYDGKQITYTFHINEIPLSEQAYLDLKLKKRDFVADSNYYTEDVINDSIVILSLHAVVKLPICIEGVEYSCQDTIPTDALQNRSLCFRKKRNLFRKNKIVVELE